MLPFVILLIIPIAIQSIRIKGVEYKKKNKFALFIFFAILLFLLMFRATNIGNDTANYMNIFRGISWHGVSGVDTYSDEGGFLVYTWILSLLTDNPQVYIAISSLVIVFLMMPVYLRLSEDTALTVALFCILSTFAMMFSGIRQMIAIAIGFLVYYFVKEKRKIPWLLTSYIATLFHTSAFMLFFMYPLYHAKITKKWLWIVVPLVLIIFIFNEQIFSFLGVYINEYTRFDSSIEETSAYTMIILFSILGVFSFTIPDESKLDREIIGLRNFLLLSIIIQLFAPLHTLAMRMGYYYMIFIPLLIPKIIKVRSQKWEQVAIFSRYMMIIIFTLYFFYTMYSVQPLHIVPYSFCWEGAY